MPLHLPIGRYRVHFQSDIPPRPIRFPGNAWRGALGHMLRRSVCVTRQAQCRECLLYRSCIYPYFWDTPPHTGAEKMRKYETAPHPFVLEADENSPLILDFMLIGQANRHLAVFLHALTLAASGPRGVGGNILTLQRVEQMDEGGAWRLIHLPGDALNALPVHSPSAPPTPTDCEIHLLTPLRVKREGRYVGPRDFRFADLFGNLLRRISLLTYFHTDSPLEADFRGLKEASRRIKLDGSLDWREQHRYSKRQQENLQMGGVVGYFRISHADLAPFWPYLWLGQFTHAGSGATMGLGRYRILASLPAQAKTPT